jgi:hypothetical protein
MGSLHRQSVRNVANGTMERVNTSTRSVPPPFCMILIGHATSCLPNLTNFILLSHLNTYLDVI